MAPCKTKMGASNKETPSAGDPEPARNDSMVEAPTEDLPLSKNMNEYKTTPATGNPPSALSKASVPKQAPRTRNVEKITTLAQEQLAKLKTGRRVNIFIGYGEDQFIAVEFAYVDLLFYFFAFCKQKLQGEKAARITIPFGDKNAVVFIYRWMLAGGEDSSVDGHFKFGNLKLPDLLTIYRHCVFLGIDDLKERTEVELRHKLQYVVPTVEQMQFILQFAPPVSTAAMMSIARLLLRPVLFDFEAYYGYARENEEFGSALDVAVEELLTQMARKSHTPYQRQSVPVKAQGTATDGKNQEQRPPRRARNHHRRRAIAATNGNEGASSTGNQSRPDRRRQPRTGPRMQSGRQHRRAPATYSGIKLMSDGEGLTTCTREVRRGEVTRTGLVI